MKSDKGRIELTKRKTSTKYGKMKIFYMLMHTNACNKQWHNENASGAWDGAANGQWHWCVLHTGVSPSECRRTRWRAYWPFVVVISIGRCVVHAMTQLSGHCRRKTNDSVRSDIVFTTDGQFFFFFSRSNAFHCVLFAQNCRSNHRRYLQRKLLSPSLCLRMLHDNRETISLKWKCWNHHLIFIVL